MNDSGAKKDSRTVTFRPTMRVREKIAMAMATNRFEDKTDLLNQAIGMGIEALKACNWDIEQSAVRTVYLSALRNPSENQPQKRSAAKS